MTKLRAVIYARYSSDLQREASIEDQVRICRDKAEAEGWEIVDIYTDVASSGSTSFRDGHRLLYEHARQGRFCIVLAESLDQLSRDQEDVAALFKAMRFNRIKIMTLAEGEVNELHVGLKGTMNALFLKDLAAKTRRGLRGRVEAGRSAGGICYGYRVKREFGPNGEAIRGGRTIDPDEAAIVIRIFEMFAAGQSPKAIARRLNAEHVRGPHGRDWRDTTIRGHRERGTGILRNELYIGRIVWNRQSYLRDPVSGKRVSRSNPQSERIKEDVAELRIVPQELWDRCRERLTNLAESPKSQALKNSQFWLRRRPKGLLGGLICCGTCGSSLVTIGKDYLRCGKAHRNAGCPRTQLVRSSRLEGLVLDALKVQLMRADLVEEFRLAFEQHLQMNAEERRSAKREIQRQLDRISQQLEGLATAISEGLRGATVQSRLDTLESEKVSLGQQLAIRSVNPLPLPLDLAEAYRDKIVHLEGLLRSPTMRDQATAQIRQLIDQIVVTGTREEPEFELVGDLAALITLANGKNATPEGVALQSELQRSVKVVAGARFELTTFRL
jgi:site-specific DNA recombinase